MSTATAPIQREGAKVRMHICEGANTHFENNSLKIVILYLRECEYRPHMHLLKN